MNFIAWITIGVIGDFLTRSALGERAYGPIWGSAVGIAGGTAAGLIVFASSTIHRGIAYTGLAALLGAAVFSGITTIIIGRGRLV